MYYVYILQSIINPEKHYTGFTENIDKRLIKHNNGEVPHTAKFKPWQILVYLVFESKKKAMEFEKYLKSHSGRAFASKHF